MYMKSCIRCLKELTGRNKEKAAIEQMRREFSANVSHELKTPSDLDFRICRNYDERSCKIGRYAGDSVNGSIKRGKQDDHPWSSDIIKLSKLDEGQCGA